MNFVLIDDLLVDNRINGCTKTFFDERLFLLDE
jgi:hypothetical protein